jgi:hypothetical protein
MRRSIPQERYSSRGKMPRSCLAWQKRCGGWGRSGNRSNAGSERTRGSEGSPILPGKYGLAATTIQRWLGVIGENQLESTPLLELLGEAEIGQAQIESATERGRSLAEMGSTLDCQVMLARGERLQGRALAAASDSAATRHLDAALRSFVRLEMPFEAARTRLMLARALSPARPW